MDGSFGGRSVIITGASAGIGEELALALAARGARLTLAARSAELLQQVAERCRAAVPGAAAIAVPGDVSRPDDCRALVEAAVTAHGGVDVLVNDAGLTMSARFDQVEDLSIFEKLIQVNYLGAVYCTHFALPHLRARRGLLVAVSSLTGKTGVPTRSGYAASKHAMQGFFDSLRIELRGSGVDVLVVSPGFVRTGIRERAFGADGRPLGRSHRAEGEKDTMPVEQCVALMVGAMERRQRELVMTARGRLGQWLKLLAPALVDRMAARLIEDNAGARPAPPIRGGR